MKFLNYTDRFIGILACASLLHITEVEILLVLLKDKFLDLIKELDFYYKATFETRDVRVGRENERWLNVILKK